MRWQGERGTDKVANTQLFKRSKVACAWLGGGWGVLCVGWDLGESTEGGVCLFFHILYLAITETSKKQQNEKENSFPQL